MTTNRGGSNFLRPLTLSSTIYVTILVLSGIRLLSANGISAEVNGFDEKELHTVILVNGSGHGFQGRMLRNMS